MRPPAPGPQRQERAAGPGQAAHMEMDFTSVQVGVIMRHCHELLCHGCHDVMCVMKQDEPGRASVVINGTTYTGSGSGSGGGLANGYTNPDVIPSSVPDPGSGSGSVMSGESEEAVQNRLNSLQGAGTQGPHR